MDLLTWQALLGDRGASVLDQAEQLAATGLSELSLATRLRRDHDPDLVAAALTQRELRTRATAKFGAPAARMWFTRDGLEQATRSRVATHRAERLARSGSSVIDLGCGIGGDLLALASAGLAVTGIELDPVRAGIAQANLDALGLPGSVLVADATTVERDAYDLAIVDPARRDGTGRVFDPAAARPDWTFVTQLLAGAAVAKTAPGLPHRLVPPGVEAEWVSDNGDLVETALWGRPLASPRRRATLLSDHTTHTLTDADDPGAAATSEPLAYLLEPDNAVIRAGLVTAVANLVDGRLMDSRIAYLTCDRAPHTPFARGYRVLEELPYREKQLRAALRARGIGSLTIKKRGVDIVPERLRPRLALRGEQSATLVLTRVAGAGRAMLVEPLS